MVKYVPLLKPFIPKSAKWAHLLDKSHKAHTFSNFGPNYVAAVKALSDLEKYKHTSPLLVNNGTTAIQVALQVTLPRGSRVAVPHFTFMATINAVLAAGMIPVILESDPLTWTISYDLLIKHKDEYDAFIVVSPMGHGVDIGRYDTISSHLNKKVVYDFAAAFGHEISRFHPTTLSFHATKQVPIGEGGAVLFPTFDLMLAGKQLINFDFTAFRQPVSAYGFNGKLDEMHCALLQYQLTDNYKGNMFKAFVVRRNLLKYQEKLEPYFKSMVSFFDKSSPQVGALQATDYLTLSKATWALSAENVAYRLYYNPTLFEMLCTNEFEQFKLGKTTPITSCLALPCYAGAPIDRICDIILKAIK
jgi:dTDP-4-amino-4,6-dideoxygalactose transaminase